MDELIRINEQDGIQTVNARELWQALESKRQFANWIQERLDGFIEESDFTVNKFVNGKATQIDYYLTIDTAKHLAMLERNEKGKAIRQYFIEVEKKARQAPATLTGQALIAAALIEAQKVMEHQTLLIESMKPAAQFYADVTGSRSAVSMAQAAKIIGMGYGQNKLFSFLRDNKILRSNNEPYQEYIDKGWFRVIEQKWTDNAGNTNISIKTLVFQKGIESIIKMIRKESV
jgi:anti-repressor protein